MPNNKVKVAIPTDPTALIALLIAVKKKHQALGDASPLKSLDWEEIDKHLSKADEQDKLSDDLYRQAEKATGERDKHIPVVGDTVRSARDILLGIFRANPDALGDYGFDVSDASAADKKPEPKK